MTDAMRAILGVISSHSSGEEIASPRVNNDSEDQLKALQLLTNTESGKLTTLKADAVTRKGALENALKNFSEKVNMLAEAPRDKFHDSLKDFATAWLELELEREKFERAQLLKEKQKFAFGKAWDAENALRAKIDSK